MPLIDNPFGGRSIEEWIASSPDAKVPQYVRDRAFARAKGRCHLSGRKILPGDKWELEHVKALALGGGHRESNLAPAIVVAHKEKTAAEVGIISKADRMRRKANGTWPKSKTPLRGRGFEPHRLWHTPETIMEDRDVD
jgi:5-methylcytosine-specific restriction endonuclease McrA